MLRCWEKCVSASLAGTDRGPPVTALAACVTDCCWWSLGMCPLSSVQTESLAPGDIVEEPPGALRSLFYLPGLQLGWDLQVEGEVTLPWGVGSAHGVLLSGMLLQR